MMILPGENPGETFLVFIIENTAMFKIPLKNDIDFIYSAGHGVHRKGLDVYDPTIFEPLFNKYSAYYNFISTNLPLAYDDELRNNESFEELLAMKAADGLKFYHLPDYNNPSECYLIPMFAGFIKLNKADKIGEKIDEIKDKIKQKFQGFYGLDKDDMSLKLKLSSLRRYIGKQLPIKDFNNIISNFSLKYFIIKFYINEEEVDFLKGEMPVNKFQIDYSFIFISEIIDEMALESNDSFFDNGIYKGHTGSTIGGYFELITIDKIKKKY
jgi:hypothetical protein